MSRFRPTASYSVFLRGLVRIRKDSNVSPTELAGRLGIPVETVREIEKGKRPIDFVQTRAWCRAMSVDFTDFVLQVGRDIEANFATLPNFTREQFEATDPADAVEGDDGEVTDSSDATAPINDGASDPLFAEFDDLEGGAR